MIYKKSVYILALAFLLSSCNLVNKISSDASKSDQSQSESVIKTDNTVHFEFDEYSLTNQAKKVLDEETLPWLKENLDVKVVVEGHCDERGSHAYNQRLGQKRALAVKSYLVKKGVKSSRIAVASYGETRPLDIAHNEEAWAKNRRGVVIEIKK